MHQSYRLLDALTVTFGVTFFFGTTFAFGVTFGVTFFFGTTFAFGVTFGANFFFGGTGCTCTVPSSFRMTLFVLLSRTSIRTR